MPIAGLVRWLAAERISTTTGKARWDRSTIWGMLRNPAYAGRAAFLKTGRTTDRVALNRTARLQGRTMSRNPASRPRPQQEWIEIPVPPIVSEDIFAAAAQRLADNQRFASRNTKEPSLLTGLVSCQSCGYAYYRTSTRTATRKLYYYRCLGADAYRYQGAGYATTSRCVPTTSTSSSGARSLPCWPIPHSSKPNSTGAWLRCEPLTRPPRSVPGWNLS
ncbi:MAG: recombinase family protein [Candidatus Dormibacteria bacterium]